MSLAAYDNLNMLDNLIPCEQLGLFEYSLPPMISNDNIPYECDSFTMGIGELDSEQRTFLSLDEFNSKPSKEEREDKTPANLPTIIQGINSPSPSMTSDGFSVDSDDPEFSENNSAGGYYSDVDTKRSLKSTLRNKIQDRRISEGKGPLVVKFEAEKKYELTPDEKRRSEVRKERNRKSANKSRIMRKQKEENLLKEIEQYEDANRKLKNEIDSWKKLKQTLQIRYKTHMNCCPSNKRRPSPEEEIAKLEEYLKSPVT